MLNRLIVQGVEFLLQRGPGGVKVAAADGAFSGAAELVNRVAAGLFGYRDWIDRLDAEPRIEVPAFSFIRTESADQTPKWAAEAWERQAGRPLPKEVRHVYLDQGYLVPMESWVPPSFLSELCERVRHERLEPEPVW